MTTPAVDDVFGRIANLLPEGSREAYWQHLAKVRKLHPDDDVLAIVEVCGWFSLISAQIPKELAEILDRVKNGLATEVAARVTEDFRQAVLVELGQGNLQQLKAILGETRGLMESFSNKTIEVADSAEVLSSLRGFRAASFAWIAGAMLMALLGMGYGISVYFKGVAEKRIAAAVTAFGEQKAVVAELQKRGVGMTLFDTRNPRTKAPCRAVVFEGPVGEVFTDTEGHGVVLLQD